jgi:hypothetical protein
MGITTEEDLYGIYILTDSSVSVDSSKKFTNFRRLVTIEGDPEHTILKVSEMLKRDCWTPGSGHLRMQIESVSMADGKMTVVLSKDHYAGE